MIGFNYWVRADRRAAVGFDLNREHWGQGIMSEALIAVVRFGFESMGLNRIEADCSIMNVASQRVLEKAGFKIEGRQREHYYLDGIYYDVLLWGMLRSDLR
jgi:ribosomal-protein-alanine N-acetyltransferase